MRQLVEIHWHIDPVCIRDEIDLRYLLACRRGRDHTVSEMVQSNSYRLWAVDCTWWCRDQQSLFWHQIKSAIPTWNIAWPVFVFSIPLIRTLLLIRNTAPMIRCRGMLPCPMLKRILAHCTWLYFRTHLPPHTHLRHRGYQMMPEWNSPRSNEQPNRTHNIYS